VLNVPVDILKTENIEDIIKEMLSLEETVHQIVLIGLPDLMKARRNNEFLSCLSTASLVLPISSSILKGAKFLKKEIPVRYMPFEFSIRLLGALENMGKTLYLYGQHPKDLQRIENNLRSSFPGLRIVGRFPGYSPKERQEDIITAIKKAAPTLLMAGRGVNDDHLWIHNNKNNFSPGIFMWCGECFDIFAGKKKRTSKTLWNYDLDFLPELIRNPFKLLRIFMHVYYGLLLFIHRVLNRS
jgi:N-acetylglucosaminyldiphosphoundecaprenol N-acetyl-beta-D-mannosaminyltransferase